MYVVLGATGHIGRYVVRDLSESGQQVIAVTHSDEKASSLNEGTLIETVVVDVSDAEALCRVLARGKRAFVLNPPADPATDTNAEELRTARSIAKAVAVSGLEKVVVASTYGAQDGEAIGDLSVLWQFEQLIKATGVPTAINRGAYYFSNFDQLVEPAKLGVLPTPFPKDFVLPMVSPIDIASAAVARLTNGLDDTGVWFIEGPKRYAMGDVAKAFSKALRRTVEVQRILRDDVEDNFRSLGFSAPAARAYARMTKATLDGAEMPEDPMRGQVTLEDHIAYLIGENAGQ